MWECSAQFAQHGPGIGARRVGQQHLAARQPGEQARKAAFGAQQFGDVEVVGLPQEVMRIDAMVAHQAEQGRAIAAPVERAQAVRLVARHLELAFDIVGHAPVDRAEDRVRCVVQRVVEVEEPDGSAAGSGSASGTGRRRGRTGRADRRREPPQAQMRPLARPHSGATSQTTPGQ